MNRGGFSWKRFIGISALKARISRTIGIPLTRSGRQKKLGAYLEKMIFFIGGIIGSYIKKAVNFLYKIIKLR